MSGELADLLESVKAIVEPLSADAIVYRGDLDSPLDKEFISECKRNKRREQVILALRTTGGSADAAYRMARSLQRNYKKVTILVEDVCKSAGTLLALAGNELVMTDTGELGPLDVQLGKPDELFEFSSGLAPIEALEYLRTTAFEYFESTLLQLRLRSGLQISTKSAADIATNMVNALYGPILQQVDPLRLGEVERSIQIAKDYGQRLDDVGKNLKPGALETLINGYPTHGFVIDREEACDLFNNVREPSAAEGAFLDFVGTLFDADGVGPPFVFMNLLAEALANQIQETTDAEAETNGSYKEESHVENYAAVAPAAAGDNGGHGGAGDPLSG